MTVGERLRNARKASRLTQKELALKSGVAEITIRKYENNQRQPKLDILKKMADILGVALLSLLGNDTGAFIDIINMKPGIKYSDFKSKSDKSFLELIEWLSSVLGEYSTANIKDRAKIIDFLREYSNLHEKYGIPFADLAKIFTYFAQAEEENDNAETESDT